MSQTDLKRLPYHDDVVMDWQYVGRKCVILQEGGHYMGLTRCPFDISKFPWLDGGLLSFKVHGDLYWETNCDWIGFICNHEGDVCLDEERRDLYSVGYEDWKQRDVQDRKKIWLPDPDETPEKIHSVRAETDRVAEQVNSLLGLIRKADVPEVKEANKTYCCTCQQFPEEMHKVRKAGKCVYHCGTCHTILKVDYR